MFVDQPEQINTINIITGYFYHNLTLTLVLGILLLSSAFFFYFYYVIFHKRIKTKYFISLMLILWAPLYLNSLYNNLYDVYESVSRLKFDVSQKRIVRYCDIDHYENLGGKMCGLFSFLAFSSKKLPLGTLVKIVTQKGTEPFIYYNYYPDFSYTYEFSKARYLLFYYPDQYFFENDILYRKNTADGQKEKIGDYSLFAQFNPRAFILENKNFIE